MAIPIERINRDKTTLPQGTHTWGVRNTWSAGVAKKQAANLQKYNEWRQGQIDRAPANLRRRTEENMTSYEDWSGNINQAPVEKTGMPQQPPMPQQVLPNQQPIQQPVTGVNSPITPQLGAYNQVPQVGSMTPQSGIGSSNYLNTPQLGAYNQGSNPYDPGLSHINSLGGQGYQSSLGNTSKTKKKPFGTDWGTNWNMNLR